MHLLRLGSIAIALSAILFQPVPANAKGKDSGGKGSSCKQCCHQHVGHDACFRNRWPIHPPNAPLLASTPALMAPIVYTPVQGQARENEDVLQSLLRLLQEHRGNNAAAAARTPRGGKTQTQTSNDDDHGAPRPPEIESPTEKMRRIDREVIKLRQQVEETIELLKQLNKKIDNQ